MALQSVCDDLLDGSNPSCSALNKAAGINARIWVTQQSQITGYSTNGTTNDISAIAMDIVSGVTGTLKKFIGKKFKNNASFPLTVGENVNTFLHTVAFAFYYSTSSELIVLQQLANADDLIAIVEGNDGKIQVYGIDLGLNASAGEGGTGTLLNDNTSYLITLSGEQLTTPRYFNTHPGATLAQNIAYLDGISE
jgi:hypothetical protein